MGSAMASAYSASNSVFQCFVSSSGFSSTCSHPTAHTHNARQLQARQPHEEQKRGAETIGEGEEERGERGEEERRRRMGEDQGVGGDGEGELAIVGHHAAVDADGDEEVVVDVDHLVPEDEGRLLRRRHVGQHQCELTEQVDRKVQQLPRKHTQMHTNTVSSRSQTARSGWTSSASKERDGARK
eukprot:445068-Rhodomonas_salina.1